MKIEKYGIDKNGFTFSLLPTIIFSYEHKITELGFTFLFWAILIKFDE